MTLMHHPNETRGHAAAVHLQRIARHLEGPIKTKDPFYQDHENYMHENVGRLIVRDVVEFLRGWPNDPKIKHEGIWEGSCYYCLPGGKGTNDEDVISYEQCPCWCHENLTLRQCAERLEALL